MRTAFSAALATAFLACGLGSLGSNVPAGIQATRSSSETSSRTYIGFDRNRYPGESALKLLRQHFSFSGYWLNPPPKEPSNTWEGKREELNSAGFGFLVLFNGRLYRELKAAADPRILGKNDAAAAVRAARKEGFPAGTVIFLDQEEGGRMLPEQRAYVYAWIDAINASGYQAGVYCSGIPAVEEGGTTLITADDLQIRTEEKSYFSFITIPAHPRPVALFQVVRRHRTKVEFHLPQSGSSLNRLVDASIRPDADRAITLTATATRPSQPMASISTSIPLIRLIPPRADAEFRRVETSRFKIHPIQ